MTFAAHIALLLAGLLPAALLVGGAHSATPRPAQDDPAAYEAKLTAADEELYTRAFRSAAHGRWDRAVRLAGQARDPLPAKILTWMRLSHGKAKLSLAELESFIAANPTWPRQKSLQIRLEKAMREGVPDSRVVALFKTRRPVSGAGRIRLAEALLTEGHRDSGAEWLRYAWVENDFERKEQKRILKAHGALLRAADHARRLDRLLWDGRRSDARALLKRVQTGQRRVAEARIALMRRARDVDRRIERVPPALHADPGLVYERARWRRRAGKTQAARDLLAKYAGDGGSRPEKWWTERNRHVRDLIEKGRMEQAYAIASRNGQPKFSAGLADGEFLAGWLALRFLKQPLRATRHFRKLYRGVRFPISRARAAYWHGRASQALGNTENATRWYGLAARHPATYYGQLATEALGRGRLLRLPRLRNPVARSAESSPGASWSAPPPWCRSSASASSSAPSCCISANSWNGRWSSFCWRGWPAGTAGWTCRSAWPRRRHARAPWSSRPPIPCWNYRTRGANARWSSPSPARRANSTSAPSARRVPGA